MTKPTKWHVRPTKSQISLGIFPVWSKSSLSTKVGPKCWTMLKHVGNHWKNADIWQTCELTAGFTTSLTYEPIWVSKVFSELRTSFNMSKSLMSDWIVTFFSITKENMINLFFNRVLQSIKIISLILSRAIIRWGQNGRSQRKTIWPPASRSWLVLHVTRARLEPTAVRWGVQFLISVLNHSSKGLPRKDVK